MSDNLREQLAEALDRANWERNHAVKIDPHRSRPPWYEVLADAAMGVIWEVIGARLTLRDLQREQRPWVQHNFGNRPSWHPLLGAVEELGELAHHHLKAEQGIRGDADEHHQQKIDAVADVIIFLADYCTAEGIDMQEALETTWQEVRTRDWRADPDGGVTATAHKTTPDG